MVWVRVSDDAIDHPKIVALSDGAFRLWVAGLCYCQKHLTDGHISRAALRGLRAMTRGRVLELTTAQTPYAALWEEVASGFQVHDYLDWNDSAETVRYRQAKQTQLKNDGKERLKKWREKQVGNAESNAECNALQNAYETPTPNQTKPNQEREKQSRADDGRINALQELYPVVYAKVRQGAFYRANPVRDYPNYLRLVDGWPLERLEKMLELFLLLPPRDGNNIPGTPGQFLHMAPYCDQKLRENGL